MVISVIIPVYNAVNYLERCIHSILNQTYQQFELIVINDGSTDNSLEELQKLLSTNNKTRIITQNNQGVSSARNTGIQHAKGKYIAFIDCDDYVAYDYLENLMEATHDGIYDLILSGTSFIQGNKEVRTSTITEDTWQHKDLEDKYYYLDYTTSIHGKLYKKEIIDKYNLRFDISMSFAEDRDFNIEFIKHLTIAHSIPYIGYTYCTDIPNSLSKKKYHYKFLNDCIYWSKVSSLYNTHAFQVYVINRFYNAIVDNISEMSKWLDLKETLHITRTNYSHKNKCYLRAKRKDIYAPTWQKELVINYIFLYCCLIYLKKHFSL